MTFAKLSLPVLVGALLIAGCGGGGGVELAIAIRSNTLGSEWNWQGPSRDDYASGAMFFRSPGDGLVTCTDSGIDAGFRTFVTP